jgi:Mrp family chromosome partitioning ATPase
MEELAMQAELGSVTVVNDGSQPPLFLGLNGMQSAVRGALIGGGICFVVLLLIASTDRRVRGVSDLQEIEAPSPVLGVLQHLSQPAASGAAACSVRKIAAHLQLSAAGGRGGVFSINSAHIGAGKTSLVLAVGTALAEAGSKTLLIDLDLREQGLTRRTTDIIDRAIADSSDEPTIRLSDAIPPQPLHEPVRPTCVPGLHVMCVREAGVMSVQAIRQLFHEARQRFDVVLVDTGAIGYCPAALVSAAEADGAVLVVARGEDRDTVRRCAHQLTQLDVKLLGIIYNHATGRDAMFWPDQPSGGSRRAGDRLDPLSGSLIADRYRASA